MSDVASSGETTNVCLMGSFSSELSTTTARHLFANKLSYMHSYSSLGVKTLDALTRVEFCCEPDTAAPADSADVRPCLPELELPLNVRLLQSFADLVRQDTRKWHIELCSDAAAIKLMSHDAPKNLPSTKTKSLLPLHKLGCSQRCRCCRLWGSGIPSTWRRSSSRKIRVKVAV
ncbi:hypothetical protein F444_04557 [Phytophthora nicotianae P1976]|uniref:Uncharacterized protein n=1 Tax=Phytophthora nicotianae P1976 TaxID=1317066 RepID=A0A081AQB1_PHYNI|nr:hypothetical protein F444_04557 [Phytophthora nicotianae P1976]